MMPPRRPLLLVYVAAVIIGGGVTVADSIAGLASFDFIRSLEFWMLAGAVVLGQFIHIRIPHGRESVTVTIDDPFALALLFEFGVGPAILAKALVSLVHDTKRNIQWWKSLFNVGQYSLSLLAADRAASATTRLISDGITPAVETIVTILVASFLYFVVNTVAVQMAIVLATGVSPLDYLKNQLRPRVVSQGALIAFTPVAVFSMDRSEWMLPLLLVPVVVVYYSGKMMQRHVVLADQLRELYEATRTAHTSVRSEDAVRELLQRVVAMFSASKAAIYLFPRSDAREALSTTFDAESDRYKYMETISLDPGEGVWARVVAEDKAILMAAPMGNPRLSEYFAGRGIKDVMVAPLRSDEKPIGVIQVADRLGDETFTEDDLNLFETLANHASVALENVRLIERLEESLVHLTEMNRLKDDFVASVSHELRTPLTSIRGYVKTLLRPDATFTPEDQRSFLEIVDRQSNRLHVLIEDLLVVSRIESRTELTTLTPVSLQKVALDVVDELRSKAEAHEIRLEFPGDLRMVETDPGKVHQVVANLIDNALKYSPADTIVWVTGHPEGEGVTLSVTDQGSGIDPYLQDRIFDRFYQVDQSSTRSVGGAGLGLYICRHMAERIGGRVWLQRSDETGSTFCLWVPWKITTAVGEERAESPL